METLTDTMDRVKNELKSGGVTKVNVKEEAGGDPSLAQRLIESAAAHAGIKVETSLTENYAHGTAVNGDDEE